MRETPMFKSGKGGCLKWFVVVIGITGTLELLRSPDSDTIPAPSESVAAPAIQAADTTTDSPAPPVLPSTPKASRQDLTTQIGQQIPIYFFDTNDFAITEDNCVLILVASDQFHRSSESFQREVVGLVHGKWKSISPHRAAYVQVVNRAGGKIAKSNPWNMDVEIQ
tara:strand:- start:732 stop:1229 length:498 start_codon:yes stop_codon:yes gene_type:complete